MNTQPVRITTLLGLSLSFLLGPIMAAERSVDDFQSVKITGSSLPLYPRSLSVKGVSGGEAAVICAIDVNGEVTDTMPLAYSHIEFYEAAITAIKGWKLEPARSEGHPTPVIQVFAFTFEGGQDVVQMTPVDFMDSWMGSLSLSGPSYRVVELSDLDTTPTPVELTRPQYPETFVGSGIEGDVIIEFYIDKDGGVRMPAIIKQTDMDFAAVAMVAIRQWRFEPPMVQGRPVTAMAQQKFHFNPSPKVN